MPRLDPSASFAAARALLVEDESLVAMLFEDYLRDMGVTDVTIAHNLNDGLRHAQLGDFDIAVLDVNLNGERSDRIAAALIERGVPFMFSTGYGRKGLSEEYAAYPVATKPPQFSDIRDIVYLLIGRRST